MSKLNLIQLECDNCHYSDTINIADPDQERILVTLGKWLGVIRGDSRQGAAEFAKWYDCFACMVAGTEKDLKAQQEAALSAAQDAGAPNLKKVITN
jgi:hypothetical protein